MARHDIHGLIGFPIVFGVGHEHIAAAPHGLHVDIALIVLLA